MWRVGVKWMEGSMVRELAVEMVEMMSSFVVVMGVMKAIWRGLGLVQVTGGAAVVAAWWVAAWWVVVVVELSKVMLVRGRLGIGLAGWMLREVCV